jgi:hypothetical protein
MESPKKALLEIQGKLTENTLKLKIADCWCAATPKPTLTEEEQIALSTNQATKVSTTPLSMISKYASTDH